jgi:sigma-B regulation protein RsbU (phosphoserine phosphatase)
MGADPRILVVDDNDDNCYTLKLHLDLEGYTDVATARDGEEAIALLETSAFDLVLLDVMMPKVDGFQVLAWLKDQARLRDLPVIMISALTEMNSMARCIELGAVDYLLKPFNPILLKARLGATLEKKRLRDEIDAHLARLQEELDAARRLQMAMVPQSFPAPSPDFPIDLCASMEPAREVGGDLYDFFVTEDGMLCFLVGDVSGKGMPAALFMARTKSLIRIATELMRSRQGTSARPAESIYVFTDGVTEAADQQGELFAEARLEAVLRAAGGCSTAAEIVTSVAEAVRGFVGNALPSDDITMLAVRRLDGAAL